MWPTVNMLVKDIERVLSTQVGKPWHGQPVRPSRLWPPPCPLSTRLPPRLCLPRDSSAVTLLPGNSNHRELCLRRFCVCRKGPHSRRLCCSHNTPWSPGWAPQPRHAPGHEQRPRRGRHTAPPHRVVMLGPGPPGCEQV